MESRLVATNSMRWRFFWQKTTTVSVDFWTKTASCCRQAIVISFNFLAPCHACSMRCCVWRRYTNIESDFLGSFRHRKQEESYDYENLCIWSKVQQLKVPLESRGWAKPEFSLKKTICWKIYENLGIWSKVQRLWVPLKSMGVSNIRVEVSVWKKQSVERFTKMLSGLNWFSQDFKRQNLASEEFQIISRTALYISAITAASFSTN